MREFADMQNIWEHQERLDNLVATDCITCNVFGIDDAIVASIITAIAASASSGAGAAAKAQGRNVQAAQAKGAELAEHTGKAFQEAALEESLLQRRKEEMTGQGPY